MRDDLAIHCHDAAQFRDPEGQRWRPAEPLHPDGGQGKVTRSCSYCGGMHPADLLAALAAGAQVEAADWKYGWPHKFYITGILNPIAGREIEIGSRTENGVTTPILGKASLTVTEKFYSTHLSDLEDAEIAAVSAALERFTGTRFWREGGRLDIKFSGLPPGYPKPEDRS